MTYGERLLARLDTMDEAEVRRRVARGEFGVNGDRRDTVEQWLEARSQERNDSFQTAQASAARDAADAAKEAARQARKANTNARIAQAIAVIAIIVSAIGLFLKSSH